MLHGSSGTWAASVQLPALNSAVLTSRGSQTEARAHSLPHAPQPHPPTPPQLHLPPGKHWHRCFPTLSNLHTEGDKQPSGQYSESYRSYVFNIISTWCCAERSSVTVLPPSPLPPSTWLDRYRSAVVGGGFCSSCR